MIIFVDAAWVVHLGRNQCHNRGMLEEMRRYWLGGWRVLVGSIIIILLK